LAGVDVLHAEAVPENKALAFLEKVVIVAPIRAGKLGQP